MHKSICHDLVVLLPILHTCCPRPGSGKESPTSTGSAGGVSYGSSSQLQQITVREEIPAEQGDEIGQGPGERGQVMQVLDDEHGDQCCPNLDVQSVLRGAHEGLHLEVLLERLEEDLYLPQRSL